MKKIIKLKKFFQIAVMLLFLSGSILAFLPATTRAQTTGAQTPVNGVIPPTTESSDDRCKYFKAQFSLGNGSNIANGLPVYCSATAVITREIQAGLAISGTVVILFLIYGGFIYLTSAGNDEAAEKGKKILINAVIGLVVIIMSTAIVTIVSGLLSGGS